MSFCKHVSVIGLLLLFASVSSADMEGELSGGNNVNTGSRFSMVAGDRLSLDMSATGVGTAGLRVTVQQLNIQGNWVRGQRFNIRPNGNVVSRFYEVEDILPSRFEILRIKVSRGFGTPARTYDVRF